MEHYEEWKSRGPLKVDWMEAAPTASARKARHAAA